ncbi:DUF4191 domain-containing protein [Actinomyces minihominis]|uniref:DUF4191 domain-containing protein n=1 Tax=Actinomyces minihominis TaxID=2002838 RepID=UPI000C07559C|nr:DUF4191 domain-containing protein [Actinomyces minihominis]
MAKKDKSPKPAGAPKKQRFYHTLIDAYKVVKRTYPWIGIALIAIPVVLIGLGIVFGILWNRAIFLPITGILLAGTIDMVLLAYLIRPAMYRQLDGRIGSVYAVISQIRRGWIVEEEPVAANKSQDIVWRLVGRPGIVLISEGPSSRVRALLIAEKRRLSRAVANVPIIFVEVGHEEGQVPLAKLNRHLKGLKKHLTKQEVPAVANRLNALGHKAIPIPKGVDPNNMRANRKALRG